MYKNIDFDEEVFIPFVSDYEDEGFNSLQRLWDGDEELLELLKEANEDEE